MTAIVKRRILWILLAGSIAFNVFFALGFIQARNTVEKFQSPRGRAEILAERLALTPEQQEVFWREGRAIARQGMEIAREIDKVQNRFFAEVQKDNPNREVIFQILSQTNDERARLTRIRTEHWLVVMQSLTPEQRKLFVDLVGARSLP
jgi:Spy/CpxP family protein refolding chaperone